MKFDIYASELAKLRSEELRNAAAAKATPAPRRTTEATARDKSISPVHSSSKRRSTNGVSPAPKRRVLEANTQADDSDDAAWLTQSGEARSHTQADGSDDAAWLTQPREVRSLSHTRAHTQTHIHAHTLRLAHDGSDPLDADDDDVFRIVAAVVAAAVPSDP